MTTNSKKTSNRAKYAWGMLFNEAKGSYERRLEAELDAREELQDVTESLSKQLSKLGYINVESY